MDSDWSDFKPPPLKKQLSKEGKDLYHQGIGKQEGDGDNDGKDDEADDELFSDFAFGRMGRADEALAKERVLALLHEHPDKAEFIEAARTMRLADKSIWTKDVALYFRELLKDYDALRKEHSDRRRREQRQRQQQQQQKQANAFFPPGHRGHQGSSKGRPAHQARNKKKSRKKRQSELENDGDGKTERLFQDLLQARARYRAQGQDDLAALAARQAADLAQREWGTEDPRTRQAKEDPAVDAGQGDAPPDEWEWRGEAAGGAAAAGGGRGGGRGGGGGWGEAAGGRGGGGIRGRLRGIGARVRRASQGAGEFAGAIRDELADHRSELREDLHELAREWKGWISEKVGRRGRRGR